MQLDKERDHLRNIRKFLRASGFQRTFNPVSGLESIRGNDEVLLSCLCGYCIAIGRAAASQKTDCLVCFLWAGGNIGPYFFKNDEGHNVTVNGDRYRAMIANFFIPELNNHDVQELWFQQDGATCHTA
ncbi:hypothetical protein TNCV_619101 [Trichonephila clavipes]|nr:hypothetical protein TNCV_619101 [Trichonephila clavipes]